MLIHYARHLCIIGPLAFHLWLNPAELQGATKPYLLEADQPAALTLKGWENDSFPLGNGYMGVSFFGGVEKELWQVTDPTIYSDTWSEKKGVHSLNLSSAVELYLEKDHGALEVTGYSRRLDILRGLGTTTYEADGVSYSQEALTSYPANCFVARLTANQKGKLAFRLKPKHSYPELRQNSEMKVDGDAVVLAGTTRVLQTAYQAHIAVDIEGGRKEIRKEGKDAVIEVKDADVATVYLTIGTNYQLEPEVYLTSTGFYAPSKSADMPPEYQDKYKKLEGNPLPVDAIKGRLSAARATGWDKLKAQHLADFQPLMERCTMDLGGVKTERPTATVLADKKCKGAEKLYLYELVFQYGRYLLASSSRPGTLPAGLQGKWNWIDGAPWTGGYWLNINFQMNYWPTFSTNLGELIEPYYDQLEAMAPRHRNLAKAYAKDLVNKNLEDVWTVGHSNHAYDAAEITRHGGIGGGPFTLLPLWEWYLFTGDQAILEKLWPTLLSSSRFLTAVMEEQADGKMLAVPSYSPENKLPQGLKTAKGTAYDQQMAYEGHLMTLTAARILGKKDPLLETIQNHLPRLDPVMIGGDPTGKYIMEFREEIAYYGGTHRHISQLVGLVPGTIVSQKPEWIRAAQTTLNLRGDKSTGWALAHRLNAWARTGNGDRSLVLLNNLMSARVLNNLWGKHPPFQIDANFGATSGIAEMLLQSHMMKELPGKDDLTFQDFNFLIHVLPALPGEWSEGSFSRMRARGGFEVSSHWKDGKATSVTIKSLSGNPARLKIADMVFDITLNTGQEKTFSGS